MSASGGKRAWAWPWELRGAGVLGMNRRNLDLLMKLNPRDLYPRVDDKSLTKAICRENRIPTPDTHATIRRFGDIRQFPAGIGDRTEFVIKPACGAAGRGVLVIAGRDGDAFTTSSGEALSIEDVRYHLSTTLSGLYSLGGNLDRAIVEQRLHRHPAFDGVAVGGTPDIRVVVYRHMPVMAMVRLPTKLSRGRANLHQGAVGAGIDMNTGRTLGGVCLGRRLRTAPDTGEAIEGVKVPRWTEILDIAERLSRALGLGYTGVDIVLDADHGPMVLEANARPGLAIQIANGCGLLGRLQKRRLELTGEELAGSHSLAGREGAIGCD